MKQLVFVVISSLLLTACSMSESPDFEKEINPTNEVSSAIRSVNEAIDLALTASEAMYPSENRSSSKKVSNPLQVKAKLSTGSRSGEPLYYVVNFDDEMGFAIVPAAADNEMVLAVTESGNVDPNFPTENEAFNDYLCAVENYLNSDIPDSLKVSPFSANAAVKELLKVDPRVTMLPNQYYPENGEIPTYQHVGYAGCGPVALLIAMSYVKLPTELDITYPKRPTDKVIPNWENIALHKSTATNEYTKELNPNCQTTSESHRDISIICAEIGYATNSTYKYNATYTDSTRFIPYITEIMPNNCYIISKDLDAILWDGIALIEGWNSSDTDGHYWIADGIHRYVYNYGTDPFGYPLYGQISTLYYHFNWGWGGGCNGYFSPAVYDPNLGSIYDGATNNTAGHQYAYIKRAVGFFNPLENKYMP